MMFKSSLLVSLIAVVGFVSAVPYGGRAFNRRQGTQFITGPCTSDADCQLGCCGFNSGKCAGAVVALTRDGGCGFGNEQSNNNAAIAQGFGNQADVINFVPTRRGGGAGAPPPPPPPANNGGGGGAVAAGTQFITGPCTSDADCQLGCCGFNSGKCAGAVVALTRDGGCGFGNEQSNNNAAIAQGFGNQADVINFVPTRRGGGAGAPPPPANNGGAGGAVGNTNQDAKKAVFLECSADSECQQGCCGFSTGKCAGPAVAQENGSGGCGRGSAAPNCDVATLLGFGGSCIGGGTANNGNDPVVRAAAGFSARLNGIAFTP